MDRIIKQKKWGAKRVGLVTGMVGFTGIILLGFYFTRGNAKLNINRERIVIGEIKTGAFRELIPITGIVMPVTTIYLDILEGGRVEEKYVEDGAILKKGQPILKLSNTDLELSLVNEETAVFNLLTQMQISHNSAQQNTISKLNQMAEVDNAYKEAERMFTMNKLLHEQKAISHQEYLQAELAYEYQVKRKKLTTKILEQDSASTLLEADQARQSYQRTKDALALMRRKVGDLVVKSPIDGQLTSLDAEQGQNKNKGERIGQVDALTGYKMRAEIDDHYISRVFAGQEAECTVDDHIYKLAVKKIYTQVTKGHFIIDLEFTDAPPARIRKGQTLQLKLALSDETQALLIPRGGFYQQTAGNWIFKLSPDGKTAYKTDIQTGRQNPDYYEVLQGLKPGDKVIISSYENYEKISELVLNK